MQKILQNLQFFIKKGEIQNGEKTGCQKLGAMVKLDGQGLPYQIVRRKVTKFGGLNKLAY